MRIQKPARKKRRSETEHFFQAAFFDELSIRYPTLFKVTFAIPNGGHRHIVVAAKLKREGVKKGVPDVFVAFPNHAYCGLFIEFKAGKNKPTKQQLDFLNQLSANNYKCVVCYSNTDAIMALEDYLNGNGR